jgi:hypothetical protein
LLVAFALESGMPYFQKDMHEPQYRAASSSLTQHQGVSTEHLGKNPLGDHVKAGLFLEETCGGVFGHDARSDASTDAGEGIDTCDEVEEASLFARGGQAMQTNARPNFLKACKEQRIEQLRRVVHEFSALDFDKADSSAQEAVVLRKLTLLKSLGEITSYYSDDERFEQTRLSLLGLDSMASSLKEIASVTQRLCEARSFRPAFEALEKAAPFLIGKTAHLSAEEEAAMKLRRWKRKQRQREERREQRRCQRSQCSAGPHRDTRGRQPSCN